MVIFCISVADIIVNVEGNVGVGIEGKHSQCLLHLLMFLVIGRKAPHVAKSKRKKQDNETIMIIMIICLPEEMLR